MVLSFLFWKILINFFFQYGILIWKITRIDAAEVVMQSIEVLKKVFGVWTQNAEYFIIARFDAELEEKLAK